METNKPKIKQYFLNSLPPTEIEEFDLQIISDAEFAGEIAMVETELIEDYLEGTLTNEESKAFESFYLVNVERKKRVEFLRTLKLYAQNNAHKYTLSEAKPSFFDSIKHIFSPRKLAFSFGGLALILTIGVSSYFVWISYNSQSDVLIALNNSQKNERTLESRISDLKYAPKVEGTRGNSTTKNEELEFAELSARNLVRQNPSAENLHELGRVYLTQKKFDEATEQLEKGIKKNPNISKLHNDLGVALLEKGSINKVANENQTKKVEETKSYLDLFAKANEEFVKAIALDKTSLESYFNQALVIESMNLPNQAKEAWENYLKLDSTSKWADEARERLKKLELNKPISKTKEEILQEFLAAKDAKDDERAWQIISGNRDLGSGKLIPQQLAFLFVDSKFSGEEAKAKEALDALVYLGNLEKNKGGDLFWKELANYYVQIKDNNIASTKKAHELMTESARFRIQGDIERALNGFETAKKIFIETQNTVEEKLCDNWIATITFQLGKLDESSKTFNDLGRFSEENNFTWLAAQSFVRLSYGFISQNKHSKSIESNLKALRFAEKILDLFNLKRIYTNLSYNYKCLGQYELSINYLQKSLLLSVSDANSTQKWDAIQSLTEVFNLMNLSRTSILFQTEALRIAHINNDALNEQLSLMYLGTLYSSVGEYGEAKDFFQKAVKKAETFESEKARNKALAFTNLRYANLGKMLNDCETAVELYNFATDYYENSEFQLHNYEAHKGKLLCYLQNNDDSLFKKELPLILEIFTKYRKEILEEKSRHSFFDNEQSVYDFAVDYEFSKENFANAFDYAEESRSRSLLDLQNSVIHVSTQENQPQIKFSETLSNPLKLNQIQLEMADDTQLLVYSVLPEKVLIWLITKNTNETATTEIRAELLQEKILNYLELVSNNIEPDSQLKLSKELYQVLISPIKSSLKINKQLIIVPDKILFQLSFATLFSEKYLVEDFTISYSPSANVFLNCSRKAKKIESKKLETLLSIGNPIFNQAEYADALQNLQSAKNEAELVADNYENAIVFTEKLATKENVKENLENADVFHFAGHYVIDENTPLLSSLVLAGKNKGESNFANYEIMAEKLSRTRLIVLSACDTGIEKYFKGEGMIGAARTFLAKDVPLVVASQWAVDSTATKDLMIRFHQLRKTENFSTAEALRQSQLEMLKTENFNQPYYWAAFTSIGGYTRF